MPQFMALTCSIITQRERLEDLEGNFAQMQVDIPADIQRRTDKINEEFHQFQVRGMNPPNHRTCPLLQPILSPRPRTTACTAPRSVLVANLTLLQLDFAEEKRRRATKEAEILGILADSEHNTATTFDVLRDTRQNCTLDLRSKFDDYQKKSMKQEEKFMALFAQEIADLKNAINLESLVSGCFRASVSCFLFCALLLLRCIVLPKLTFCMFRCRLISDPRTRG
jgi:hypothetical protein